MSVDRKFEVLRPTLDRLVRSSIEVSDLGLIKPLNSSPLALVDGELVQLVGGKWARASDATKPAFFWLEDRGDIIVQGTRKGAAIVGGGHMWINTPFFDSALETEGAPVKFGAVTIQGQSRAGLIAAGNSGIVLGYVMKPAAINGGRLQVLISFN